MEFPGHRRQTPGGLLISGLTLLRYYLEMDCCHGDAALRREKFRSRKAIVVHLILGWGQRPGLSPGGDAAPQ